jgi:hypothetical protein
MQSAPITTDVVSSNLDQGEVHNIMWLAKGRWFSPGLLVSSTNETDEDGETIKWLTEKGQKDKQWSKNTTQKTKDYEMWTQGTNLGVPEG